MRPSAPQIIAPIDRYRFCVVSREVAAAGGGGRGHTPFYFDRRSFKLVTEMSNNIASVFTGDTNFCPHPLERAAAVGHRLRRVGRTRCRSRGVREREQRSRIRTAVHAYTVNGIPRPR